MTFLYILHSKIKDRYYIGVSADVEDRLFRHNNSGSRSTKCTNDWKLVYKDSYSTRSNAMKREYEIKAKAEDTTGREGEWSIYSIRIGDQPPDSPNIYGAVQGKPGVEYEYGFVSTDPENDNLTFDINWGDGNIETDRGPVLSGEFFTRTHTWNDKGTYTIRVRANDNYNNSGPWTEQTIIVYTKGKSSNFNLLNVLFERFPRAFLAFRYFINIGGGNK